MPEGGEGTYTTPHEAVEDIRPSYREVAVAVPQFRDESKDGKIVSTYVGDTYVCGYELLSGVIDEATIRADPRITNNDPNARIIIYETSGIGTRRIETDTRNVQSTYPEGYRAAIGKYAPGSLRFKVGQDLGDYLRIDQQAQEIPTPPEYQASSSRAQRFEFDTKVTSVLIRTPQPLNDQQVAQFKQAGAINETAKRFAIAPSKAQYFSSSQ